MSDPHDREPVDQATIDCWRANYGLDKRTPAEAAKWWSDRMRGLAPSGCVAALGVALDELAALRKDAERYRWLRDEEGAHAIFSALYFNTQTPEQLDAELDAAIARTRAVGAA